MSPDTLGMIVALFTFMASGIGGVAALLAHQMKRIDARFDAVDTRFNAVDTRFNAVDTRLTHLESELVDVKITIARLEGPQRRFQHP
jgi:non-ribosomal peptide synthetase component E (peptide arylation enzyme)